MRFKTCRRSRRARLRPAFRISILVLACCYACYLYASRYGTIVGESGSSHRYSAIYTPINLTPYGGEKVILSFVSKFQQLTNERVDLLVKPKNVCVKVQCVKVLAKKLQVNGIDWRKFSVKVVNRARPKYNVWFSMANILLPQVESRGRFNIYHCQFPMSEINKNKVITVNKLVPGIRRLTGYDIVYVNSHYTKSWYERILVNAKAAALPTRKFTTKLKDSYAPELFEQIHLPRIVHFSPPFQFQAIEKMNSFVLHGKDRNVRILLIGRFFKGSQGKGHPFVIKAFSMLKKSLPGVRLKLELLGHVVKGHEMYLRYVRLQALWTGGVYVNANADENAVRSAIRAADIVWSTTGIHEEGLDPGNAEHFGLALLECMSAGLVPIVVNRGGPREILEGFPDYLKVVSYVELATSTKQLILASPEEFKDLSMLARSRAEHFSTQFDSGVASLFSLFGQKLTPQNRDIWFAIRARIARYERGFPLEPVLGVSSCPSIHEDTKAILYFDDRYEYALRATATQLVQKLGEEWRFHVWHTDSNAVFVRDSLQGFDCVVFHSIGTVVDTMKGFDPRHESNYNKIWKSVPFLNALGKNVKNVLTFQSDAWFPPKGKFKTEWLHLDYIGAPWCHEGNWGYLDIDARPPEAARMLHDTRKIPYEIRVGNGGVSLRNFQVLKKIAREHAGNTSAQENEDVFYVSYLHAENYKVGSISEATEFGLEVMCEDIVQHQSHSAGRFEDAPVPFLLHKPFDIFTQMHQRGEVDYESFLNFFF